jgi:hypothetical protein
MATKFENPALKLPQATCDAREAYHQTQQVLDEGFLDPKRKSTSRHARAFRHDPSQNSENQKELFQQQVVAEEQLEPRNLYFQNLMNLRHRLE